MCSILRHSTGLFKLHLANSSSHDLSITSNTPDDIVEWCETFMLFTRIFAYISVLVTMVMVLFVILKHIMNLKDEDISGEIRTAEDDPLQSRKIINFNYETYDSNLESRYYNGGNSSSCGSSSNNNSATELYDGKLCIICYDEERNCFFVPCGHCATCYVCAERICHVENKVCPVCRRSIGKVRKLFAP